MIAYLDTSAVTKILLGEEGSEIALAVCDTADRLVSSRAVQPEARAALAAAARDRRIRPREHTVAKGRLATILRRLDFIELTDAVAELAGDLAEQHALRGYDAIHLACAIAANAVDDVTVTTWDRALGRSALRSGLACAGGR